MEVFSGSESEMESEEVDGESHLSMLLVRANEAATEQELWSCFLLRRSFYVLDVFIKPCVITIRQVLAILKIFLKSLTKLEKTGYRYFDELLSAVTTMFHTYEDRHQVLAHQWYVKIFVLLFTKLINIFLAYPVTGNYCQER